jgi:hypothetical protein
MDNEAKELLRQNIELNKENNDMLKKLVRGQKRAFIYRIVYWGIIIFSTLGAFYFIKPLLGNVLNIYTGGISGSTSFTDIKKNLSGSDQMQEFFNSLK